MTTHRGFRQMLARRGELSPADERRLRAHLEGCAECRATAAAYEQQLRLLRSLPTLQPPPALRAGVLQRIHAAPAPVVPWYRRMPTIMPPLAAAAVLALVAVAWLAGSRVTGEHGNQNNAMGRLATPTTTLRGTGADTQVPGALAPSTPRPGGSKRVGSRHATLHHTPPSTHAHSSGRSGSSSSGGASSASGAARVTATPVVFDTGTSLAAGVPTTYARPTPIQVNGAGSTPRKGSRRPHAAHATSAARPTAAPTTGAVGVAVGPPPSIIPPARPPALAPIKGTPSPAAPIGTPVVAATPAGGTPPLPIVLDTPTPSPVSLVYGVPLTPTPTTTATATPQP